MNIYIHPYMGLIIINTKKLSIDDGVDVVFYPLHYLDRVISVSTYIGEL